MTLTHRSHRPRQGYTLIELLVVIAIIGILMGMLMVAIFPALWRGKDVEVRRDISQLSVAIEAFKSKYKIGYIPSRIVLREMGDYNTSDPLEAQSLGYLKVVFGESIFANGRTQDWNGNGQVDPTPVTLEGQECLVFFLGGIPAAGQVGCTGFSTIRANPTVRGGTRETYFEFPVKRLRQTKGAFMSFVDPFNSNLYAYFSSYGRDNGYNKYAQSPLPGNTAVPTSDCQTLRVWPYLSGNSVYHNPKGFQIICAGKDGQFGPGNVVFGLNNPVTGTGADDMSNFHDKRLGAP